MDEDAMIEAAVQVLLSEEPDPRHLVRLLVTDWPDATALQILYTISMAAGTVEHMLSGPLLNRAAQNAWRMAGLVAVDLFMMEQLSLPHATAADLLAYWRVHDRFFLDR